MFATILEIFATIWGLWAGVFSAIPYWDPYGASFSVVLLIATGGLLVQTVRG